MLSLLKKSDAPPPVEPFWHSDFRNREKLPDIKAVRTTFWINGPAIFIVLAIGMYVGIQEWQLRGLNKQIAETEAKITRDKKPSDQAKALFAKFQQEDARINDVQTFVTSKPSVSALILRLAETLPPNIAIDQFDLRENGLILRLSVRGDKATASGLASDYLEKLRSDKQLSVFEDFAFTSTPNFNPATNNMSVEFVLRLKGAKK